MRKWLSMGFGLVVVALLSAAGTPKQFSVERALAAQTWNVQVGGDIDGGTSSATGFFPATFAINAGDTVSWTFPSVNPHAVTFDAGIVPGLFFTGVVPVPATGELDVSGAFLPLNLDTVKGVFDPKVQINSGVPQDPPDQRQPFTLTFNAPGVYSYQCAIHGPAMNAWISVAPSGSALSETPAQAKARGQSELAAAVTVAKAAIGTFIRPAGSAATPGGATVYGVSIGVQPFSNIAALQFFPSTLTVHQGETVVFNMSDPQEVHTVTFTSGEKAPAFVDVRPQPAGPPKIIFPANVANPVGGNVYDGTGYLNSGLMFPAAAFVLTITAPPGTYEYVCLLHGDAPQNMKATITVVP